MVLTHLANFRAPQAPPRGEMAEQFVGEKVADQNNTLVTFAPDA